MPDPAQTFTDLVEEILRRFCVQNAREPGPESALAGFANRLHAAVQRRGLPRPLADRELGSPGELPERECTPLLEEVLGAAAGEERVFFAIPLRQLVKACFHEEFKTCRDSFREVSPDGICRRQQTTRARLRVSGAHCIDCPHWVTLPRETHVSLLKREWQPENREEFEKHQTIFLPEDFRRLRRYLHHAARHPDKGL